ncbi:O-antigen ligase family protein [Rhodococcus opacus]|uniref:O-antigen ligase family protein n=1 Tax=Rhodococcus opacus TaxID=37919 RepID=UPI0012FD2288|nr:O-antigen ligase family protein [Rhodococcus opacus]
MVYSKSFFQSVSIPPLIVCASLTFVLPIDFVALSPFWRSVSTLSLIVGSALATLVLLASNLKMLKAVGLGAIALVMLNQFFLFNPVALLTIAGPLLIGMATAYVMRGHLLFVMASASVVNAVLLAWEYSVKKHVVSYFFGVPFQESASEELFRARGFLGQPVPASMVAVALCFAVLSFKSESRNGVAAAKYATLCATVVTLLVTGTRSAALILIVGCFLLALSRPQYRRIKVPTTLAVVGPLLLAVLVACLGQVIDLLSGMRIASFETLSGSSSLDNRVHALDVFEYWSENCNGSCVIFGSGARSLLLELSNSLGILGFSTVDNLYMSILWDFGLIGLMSISVLLVLAARRLRRSDGYSAASAGSIIVILTLASGLLYDSLYIRSALFVFGFGLALIGILPPVKVVEQNLSEQSGEMAGAAESRRFVGSRMVSSGEKEGI